MGDAESNEHGAQADEGRWSEVRNNHSVIMTVNVVTARNSRDRAGLRWSGSPARRPGSR